MTILRDVDNVLFGGAFYGVGQVAGELAAAGKDRLLTHGLDYATGALVGRGTEWQRALLVTSKWRPTTRGHAASTTDHPANVITYGDEVTVHTRDGSWTEGVVFGLDEECLELEDQMSTYDWDDIVRIEAGDGAIWSCYEGDNRWDYEIPASRRR